MVDQFYTSIPEDVLEGDKFEFICCKQLDQIEVKTAKQHIGAIVTLTTNDQSSRPFFSGLFSDNPDYVVPIDWGYLKPFEKKYYYTSKPTDVKVGDQFVVINDSNWDGDKEYYVTAREGKIGDIVTLIKIGNHINFSTFTSPKDETVCIYWGALKPLERKYHYTSKPNNVSIWDKFKVIGNTHWNGEKETSVDIGRVDIGDELTLIRISNNINCSFFLDKENKECFLYWGIFEPLNSQELRSSQTTTDDRSTSTSTTKIVLSPEIESDSGSKKVQRSWFPSQEIKITSNGRCSGNRASIARNQISIRRG